MTNEEAIRIAQGLITDFKCESETMVDFCNVVIKALKKEPCEDAISRQAVLDLIGKQIDHSLWAFEKLVNGIKDLPSVKPQVICPSHGIDCEDCPAYGPKTDVLDKIRAEIKGMYIALLKGTPEDDWAFKWNDCIDEVLEIIDKYKAESD